VLPYFLVRPIASIIVWISPWSQLCSVVAFAHQ
jgi:hypothetical protein